MYTPAQFNWIMDAPDLETALERVAALDAERGD